MKLLPLTITTLLAGAVALFTTGISIADDSLMFRKNVSKTPELETEHAALRMLPVYVPAQSSDGTLEEIDYYDAAGALIETRAETRPLISFYTDGHVEGIDEEGYGGFPGHGERDAFAAVSLDDGASWNRTNLSESAHSSSYNIRVKKKSVPYPGDVGRSAISSDGNQVLAVWVSRYALGGSPNYAMTDDDRAAVATHFGSDDCSTDDLNANPITISDPKCLYYVDYFGVTGSQGSSDLADEGLPLIGELPYAALWIARGVILPNQTTATGELVSRFVWFKAERLSSARRDANRPEVACVKGAGCVVTWQEDPDGMRPGEGEGPGEGWSGAIAHHQTDTWYSYISWSDFALVQDDAVDGYGTPISLAAWMAAHLDDGKPKAAIPMSIPVRLTDNSMCTYTQKYDTDGNVIDPYCYADFDGNGAADLCASEASVLLDTGVTMDMCVTQDGRLMRGNTASTRARPKLHGYSSLGDPAVEGNLIDSAWFSVAYEENKGLGEDEVDAGLISASDPTEYTKVDMGKNVWYHTFDMFNPELLSQGLMLNQPAIYQDDFTAFDRLVEYSADGVDYKFMEIYPDPIYADQAGLESTLLQSEIARRPSPITQDWYKAGDSGTVALQLWKQGIIRRGGPADIFGRRFVIPDEFDPATDNPYGYDAMACNERLFTDGSNPRYVKGLCIEPAINLSGNTILTGDLCGETVGCQDAFPFNEYFDDLEGGTQLSKILTWQQYGPNDDGNTTVTEGAPADLTNLNDTSWDNPYDVAKGHRGFMVGDMIMAMYAWSPNWLANTVGHDNYNLYARRSFDGGQTWTTTPSDWSPAAIDDTITWTADGTTTCEWMGPAGGDTEYPVCTTYAAGDFEQARNLSQLVGTQETILDPRYSPTPPSITDASVTTLLPEGFDFPLYHFDTSYDSDTQDPSVFFMVYETGDNTTVAEGEAEPLDLFYSRAVNWGDDYLVLTEETDLTDCYPGDTLATLDESSSAGFCNEFDALEGSSGSESGEASITASPGGNTFYAVWNQVDFDRKGNEVGSDAWFRRVLFLDGYPGDDSDDDGGDDDPKPPKGKKN